MSYLYFTMVKASPEFWEKLLMKQIDKNLTLEFLKNKTDEIIITTKNRHAVDKIINLSKEYPKEVFQVKITTEDIYEHYVYLYKCSNGDLKLIKEGFEYCFFIKASDLDKLDKVVYDTFKKKVAAYFKRIGKIPLNDVHLDLTIDDDQQDETDANLSLTIEYKTPNVCLTAKKHGITYIEVKVDFFDTKEKSLKPERQSRTDYDDLPF
jgi:hypothetical protein